MGTRRCRRLAALAGVGAAALAAGAPAADAALAWRPCGGDAQCATLRVPLDHAAPQGPTIRLALTRLPALRPRHRIGSLLVNPGGPGGSGVTFVRDAGEAVFSRALRERFDIVGFDPRGVGRSTRVRCGRSADGLLTSFDPLGSAGTVNYGVIAVLRRLGRGCAAVSGTLLGHVDTASAARDLEVIREAVGDAQLSYFGFSYGTELGAAYAELYPTHVRALVLDGAVDPALTMEQERVEQAQSFERALHRFLAWCDGPGGCSYRGGRRAGPTLDALLRRLARAPLPAGGTRRADRSVTISAVAAALYDRRAWPILAEALSAAVTAGDGSVLYALGRSGDSELGPAGVAIDCLDKPAPTLGALPALARRFLRAAPHFGPDAFYGVATCTVWPQPPVGVPHAPRAEGAPPILVVGTTGDPATPYRWARSLSRELASGVLLTRIGDGHTAYGTNACIQRSVDAYVLTLRRPTVAVCRPD